MCFAQVVVVEPKILLSSQADVFLIAYLSEALTQLWKIDAAVMAWRWCSYRHPGMGQEMMTIGSGP